MYEIAYLDKGHLVRGGIKAPLLVAEEWLRERTERDPLREWAIVPASESAMTGEELYAQLDEMFERRHEK